MAADMRQSDLRARLRQVAITGVFIVGSVAIVATSPPRTTVNVPASTSSFQLDDDHPTALSRIVVRVNAEASSGHPDNSVNVKVISVRPAGAGASSPSAASSVRVIVTSATPDVAPQAQPSVTPNAPPPTPWQTPLSVGAEQELPIQCGVGPCERVFWLIGQLTADGVGPVVVDWSVGGYIAYNAMAWPSGAGATVELGEPVLLGGPVAQLAASTEVEHVTLGPTNPAFARIVEVRVGSEAIPADGSPLATLSVDLANRPFPSPAIAIYPVDEETSGPTPTSPPGIDPFAGCDPGADCIRRFLVTMAWTGADKDQTFDWQLTVRRVDLVRVWSTPADLSAQVERRFDIAEGSSSTTHREGEVDALDSRALPQFRLSIGTHTTADEPLASLLPVPAVLRYNASIVDPSPAPSADVARVQATVFLPIPGDPRSAIGIELRDGSKEIIASAMASQSKVCRIAETCPDLEIATSVRGIGASISAPPHVRVRWGLDVTVYSYTEVPISVSIDDQ